jgi:hypothetical protein
VINFSTSEEKTMYDHDDHDDFSIDFANPGGTLGAAREPQGQP